MRASISMCTQVSRQSFEKPENRVLLVSIVFVYSRRKQRAPLIPGQLLACRKLDNARENTHNYITKI